MNLDGWMDARVREVEGWLKAWHGALEAPAPLKEAMGYSLFAGGKRLRPVLALAAAEACGVTGRPAPLKALCCALEMVHTYSLIHDDLPILDDDDLRRGRPTNHKVYGDALALLAGDALLTEAFHVLGEGPADEARARAALVARLGRAAGAWGMVGGQVMDVRRTAVGAGLAAVEEVHRRKTGALIAVACAGGATAAGAEPEAVDALQRFGEAAGLAFQVADDILDETGDAATLGKAVHKDAERDTATVPRAVGLDAARARARALADEASEALAPFGEAAAPLAALARRMVEREA